MIDALINSIGKQLNIPKSNDNEWVCQVVYSVAGQMALASLWDHSEDDGSVAIQHFKNRMGEIFEAYESLHPQIRLLLPQDKTDLIGEMYDIYLRSGFFYHSAHQLSPAAPAMGGNGGIVLHRGFSPDLKLFMSGLGFYSLQDSTPDRTILSMFGLQGQSLESYLEELLTNCKWEQIKWPENAEFLRLDPPFNRGYWQQAPEKSDRVSIARYGELNKIFVFYRYDKGLFLNAQIPGWRIRDYFLNVPGNYDEYRRIAISLLKNYGTLPAIKMRARGELIEIKLGYRLPPSEENFFKLYSWPVRYDFTLKTPQVFTRLMARQIYPMFKHELESIGYSFEEE